MLTDHVAILTQSSLAEATPNKKKPGSPLQFYGLFAFPPEASNDLFAALQAKSVEKNHPIVNGVTPVGVARNDSRKNEKGQPIAPLPGVPGDWLVVRASTQYAPDLFDEAAQPIVRDAANLSAIRSRFYAGKRVRVQLNPYHWTTSGGGFSWNVTAVMDAGVGGDRITGMGGGADVDAFRKHATSAPVNQSAAPTAPTANPFDAPQQTTPPAQQANPFAQATGTANPFGAPAA